MHEEKPPPIQKINDQIGDSFFRGTLDFDSVAFCEREATVRPKELSEPSAESSWTITEEN
jgi:hypothetical protein